MILPGCVNSNYKNYQNKYFGFDDLRKFDTYNSKQLAEQNIISTKEQFLAYPKEIFYSFNSRGFRDEEWPNDESLKQNNFCIGDSNVIGVGLPKEDTYNYILNQRMQVRFINLGKSSANNYTWNTKLSLEILKDLQPKHLIIHWSPFYKSGWRRNAFGDLLFGNRKEMSKFIECIENVESNKMSTNIIHVFNTLYHDFYDFFNRIDSNIKYVLFEKKDLARDAVHYGVLSHIDLVEKICQKL